MQKGGDLFFNRRGQLTIFIIFAIVIVAFGAASYFLFPQLLVNLGIGTNNPEIFLQNCMQEEIEDSIEKISSQGGSLNPENYILYNGVEIEYLCYTNQYYIPCVLQQPFLKQHIENEIKESIKENAQACLDGLKSSFERQGYVVSSTGEDIEVEILPRSVIVSFNNELTLTKDGSQRYEGLRIFSNSNLYELIGIANSILNFEVRFGDSETTAYMYYYRDLKVEKLKQSDGSTIYILTDRKFEDKFQFASRSVAWPPGIGVDGVL